MVSTLKGPIPPHPYYDPNPQESIMAPARSRTRPEAADNAAKGRAGSAGLLLHIEGQRAPTVVRRTTPKPRNHFQENLRRIRRLQRENKDREKEGELAQPKPVKALWRSTKYDNVQSKLKALLEQEPLAPRPQSGTFLRAHSAAGWFDAAAAPSRPATAEPKGNEPLSLAKSQEMKLIRRYVDYVKLNGKAVGKMQAPSLKRSASADDLSRVKSGGEQVQHQGEYARGVVPKYLLKRKEMWAMEQAERMAKIPDPDMPAGHRLMSQEERHQTLDKLKENEKELTRQLQTMPVSSDTIRSRTKKMELEKQLAGLEEAIKIFSKPKVFVKMDS